MKQKVFIYCDELYAGDILWGFTTAGCDAKIIKPAKVADFDRLIGETDPDLLVLSSYMGYFDHSMLLHIGSRQSAKYKCVCWDTEGVGQFELQMTGIEMAKPDMIFSICPEMVERLKSKGMCAQRLDFAYNPTIHYPKSLPENCNEAISLVGNAWLWYANHNPMHYRYSKAIPMLLKPLIENNFEINFYGSSEYQAVIKKFLNLDVPMKWFKGTIPYKKTCDIYNESFVNLITQNHDLSVTRRTFEIMGCGGFGLSCYNAAVKEMFGDTGGLAISNSPNETLELIAYYRENRNAYAEVRKNAVISVQNHTYKQRAEQMLYMIKGIQFSSNFQI